MKHLLQVKLFWWSFMAFNFMQFSLIWCVDVSLHQWLRFFLISSNFISTPTPSYKFSQVCFILHSFVQFRLQELLIHMKRKASKKWNKIISTIVKFHKIMRNAERSGHFLSTFNLSSRIWWCIVSNPADKSSKSAV